MTSQMPIDGSGTADSGPRGRGYPFESANLEPRQVYRFGNRPGDLGENEPQSGTLGRAGTFSVNSRTASGEVDSVERQPGFGGGLLHMPGLWPEEPKFGGQGSARDFLREVEEFFHLAGIPENQQVLCASSFLRGDASRWWRLVGQQEWRRRTLGGTRSEWQYFCQLISENYPDYWSRVEIARELFKRRYDQGSVEVFLLRSVELYRLWRSSEAVGSDDELIEILLSQLPVPMREHLELRRCSSVSVLLREAKRFESRHQGESTEVKRKVSVDQSSSRGPRCYTCGEFGHISRFCGKGKRESKPQDVKLLGLGNFGESEDFLVQVVQLEGVYFRARIDTGADRTVVSRSVAQEIVDAGAEVLDGESLLFWSATSQVRVSTMVKTQVEFLGHVKVMRLYVVPDLPASLVIGVDLLAECEVQIDFCQRKLTAGVLPYRGSVQEDEVRRLSLEAEVVESREELFEVLMKFPDLFRDKPGCTNFIEHSIPTGEHAPVYRGPYKVSIDKQCEIERQVEEMLADGIIEPASSAWSSPVHLVKKRDDTWRFCVDFRLVNQVTRDDRFPLPLITEVMDQLGTSRYVSTLDLASGYWQVRVVPKDREKTAFCCRSGSYQFRVMPFGLKNAPSTFQRLMNKVLMGPLGRCCQVYLDDIIVYSASFAQHLRDLEEVLGALRRVGLTLKSSKCFLLREEFDILGFRLMESGWTLQADKIQAIRDFPIPTRVKQVQSFLGLCGWYQQFIPGFAEIASPLHQLIRKGRRFEWSESCLEAFEKLKLKLCERPVLARHDYGLPLVLYTDASEIGLGAILQQRGSDGVEQPIAYASRVLSGAEKNYPVTEREGLAVVWAVQKFRHFFTGEPVTVVTDHAALTHWNSAVSLKGRLYRWSLLLQECPLVFQHREGRKMGAPDALSRQPGGEVTTTQDLETGYEHKLLAIFEAVSPDRVRKAQQEDPEALALIDFLGGKSEGGDEGLKGKAEHYVLENGLLCRKGEVNRVVIPGVLRQQVLKELHEHGTSGHLGIRKTFERSKVRVFWTGLRKDVERYVRGCENCQKFKSQQGRKAGFMQSTEVSCPGELVGVDLVGPLPKSGRGNEYLLVFVDYYSKWVELFPVRRATTRIIARKLVHEYCTRFGFPKALVSDNGSQFVSALFLEICNVLGIKRKFTTPYHPQSNLTERINKTLKQMIAMYVDKKHGNWDLGLSFFGLAIRTAMSETTGCTPARLFMGRELALPFDQAFQLDFWRRAELPLELLTEVNQNVKRAQRRQRRNYNLKRRQEVYSVGDRVLLRTHPQSSADRGVTAKLMPKWEGPYTVCRRITEVTYNLEKESSGESKGTHHVSNLKRFIEVSGRGPQVNGSQIDPSQNGMERVEESEALEGTSNREPDTSTGGTVELRKRRNVPRVDYRRLAGLRTRRK